MTGRWVSWDASVIRSVVLSSVLEAFVQQADGPVEKSGGPIGSAASDSSEAAAKASRRRPGSAPTLSRRRIDRPPLALPDGLSASGLRVAALVPFVLAVPFALVAAGVVPDPFGRGDIAVELGLVGWLACGISSPQDFPPFWHAETVLANPAEYLESWAERPG